MPEREQGYSCRSIRLFEEAASADCAELRPYTEPVVIACCSGEFLKTFRKFSPSAHFHSGIINLQTVCETDCAGLFPNVGNRLKRHPKVTPLVQTFVKSPTAQSAAHQRDNPVDQGLNHSDSVQAAAHELRSPISSLLAFTRVLEKRVLEGTYDSVESFVELSQAIRRNAEQVSLLVDDLLDASFADAGELSMDRHIVNLSQLISATIDDLRPHTDLRDQTVLVDIERDLLVIGDMARLCQALRNIVLNSSKYSPDGNGIKICARREQHLVRVDVIDEGMGISRRDLAHLFERSFRGSAAIDKGIPGSGLGLYLTKRVVDQHGGSIEIASRLGKGTIVTMRLVAIDPDELVAQA